MQKDDIITLRTNETSTRKDSIAQEIDADEAIYAANAEFPQTDPPSRDLFCDFDTKDQQFSSARDRGRSSISAQQLDHEIGSYLVMSSL